MLASSFHQILRTYLRLNCAVIRRTSGRSLGSFKAKECPLCCLILYSVLTWFQGSAAFLKVGNLVTSLATVSVSGGGERCAQGSGGET